MKKDIILSGVGGQGILSIATVIAGAALWEGLQMKQAEVHGMSQRGGDVHSHLRLSDAAIASDLIGEGAADLVIAMEPMEALRYRHMLCPEGKIVTDVKPFVNIPNYPDEKAVLSELHQAGAVLLDPEKLAKENNLPARATNMLLLGAAAPYIGISIEALAASLGRIFGRKGQDVVDMNVRALRIGAGIKS